MRRGRGLAVVLTALGATALGGAGCGPRGPAAPTAEELLAPLALEQRVGQLVVAPLGGPGSPLDSVALEPLRRLVGQGRVGGVEVLPGNAPEVAAAVRWLRRAGAPAPLLAVARLDGGGLPGGAAFPAPAALAGLGTAEEARAAGAHMGRGARAVGVDLAMISTAPTPAEGPLPVPARRPQQAARGIAALVEGLAEGGVMPGVRALWTEDPAEGPLGWSRPRWEAIELPWIAAARRAGAQAVQLGAVRVPGLTGDSVPLPLSAAAVRGLLRRDLAWAGLVVADLGPAGGLAADRPEEEAAVLAVAAGADLLLGARDPERVTAAVVAAVRAGTLDRERVDEAALRVLRAKLRSVRLPEPAAPESAALALRDPAAVELAESLAVRLSLRLPGPGGTGAVSPGDSGVVVVTPLGRGETLARILAGALPRARHQRVNLTADSARVRQALAAARDSGSLLVRAVFPSAAGPEPTLLPAAAEATDAAREVPVLLLPWSLDRMVERGPAVVSWGIGPPAQRAAAGLLLGTAPQGPRRGPLHWPPAPSLRPAPAPEAGMDEAELAEVDQLLRAAVADGTVSAAALAVGRRGRLVRLRGYGEVAPGTPVDPERTLFDLASLTKVVGTTAATMVLVDRGVLELDDPVERFLPEFHGEGKEEVTVRHLLAHTSGLPSGLWLYGSARSPEQALRQAAAQPLQRPPGERAEYSDLGMILQAELLERAARMPLERLLARAVFAPLGMPHTQFLPPAVLQPTVVPTTARSEQGFVLRGVVHDANAFRLGGVTGHAGLFSTARDLAVFSQTMLNRGAYGTVRLISPEVVDSFTRKQPGAGTRALGWDTPAGRSSAGRYFSESSFGHTGFTGTSIWIDPERELFVVLLTNRTFPESSATEMLRLRAAVHDAVAQSITDQRVGRRPGAR